MVLLLVVVVKVVISIIVRDRKIVEVCLMHVPIEAVAVCKVVLVLDSTISYHVVEVVGVEIVPPKMDKDLPEAPPEEILMHVGFEI